MQVLIKGGQIFSENQLIENGYVKIENQKIIEIGSLENLVVEPVCRIITVPSHYKMIPGFIDLHIHGIDGADTMDGTKEALHKMAIALPREGTTSFLATTITQEYCAIEKAVVNVTKYMNSAQSPGKAEVLGIHLEGPYINPNRAGAQPIEFVTEPNLPQFRRLQELSKGNIKVVTLAPELPGGLELIRHLIKHNIIASIGHSDATYNQVLEAINAGVSQVTHLFNQMRGVHHREPGIAGAALIRNDLKTEIIVDGIHIRPEMIELAYKAKGSEGLLLITDSMRAKCLKEGKYDLGGQEVTVMGGIAMLSEGILAGSTLKMGEAVKNIIAYTQCSLEEAIEMASVNPAKQLNIYHKKGSLRVGKDADIVILDENLNVFKTFCRGEPRAPTC